MNRLSVDKRAQIVAALVEGCSIRATVRMTGASKNTIAKLVVELGEACAKYLDKALVNLPAQKIQCDEIWSYVAAKQKNVTPAMAEEKICGDVWTWVAIGRGQQGNCLFLDDRTTGCRYRPRFYPGSSRRLRNRIQLTTDGLKVYVNAVLDAFGTEIDYAILHKVYGAVVTGPARYWPG